jgi:hypothetical protein
VAESHRLAPNCKRSSVLRRIPPDAGRFWTVRPGAEGDVGVFRLEESATQLTIEDQWGRMMSLLAGDVFLATPGNRESTRSVVGCVPDGGLLPGQNYWILAECGVVGDLVGTSPAEFGHLGEVTFLGTATDATGQTVTLNSFAEPATEEADQGAPIFLVLGTSAEVGKTTVGLALLRSLVRVGHGRVIALKATGTSLYFEIASYLDFGAALALDCVDFGLPTTYPSGRTDVASVFERAIRHVLAEVADAVIIECGGDILGANVPQFLVKLRQWRSAVKVVLVAPDALAALGASGVLREMGWSVNLISGPCTDSPILLSRTQSLCGIPARNMYRHQQQIVLP